MAIPGCGNPQVAHAGNYFGGHGEGPMEEIRASKEQIRKDMAKVVGGFTEKQRKDETRSIENRLFDFANFLGSPDRFAVRRRRKRGSHAEHHPTDPFICNKIVVLPVFDAERCKVDDP